MRRYIQRMSNTVCKKNYLTTKKILQVEKGIQLLSMMFFLVKRFRLLGDCMVNLTKKNETFRFEKHNEEKLKDCEIRRMIYVFDQRRAGFNLNKMKKHLLRKF